jgi:hypothetical protein
VFRKKSARTEVVSLPVVPLASLGKRRFPGFVVGPSFRGCRMTDGSPAAADAALILPFFEGIEAAGSDVNSRWILEMEALLECDFAYTGELDAVVFLRRSVIDVLSLARMEAGPGERCAGVLGLLGIVLEGVVVGRPSGPVLRKKSASSDVGVFTFGGARSRPRSRPFCGKCQLQAGIPRDGRWPTVPPCF